MNGDAGGAADAARERTPPWITLLTPLNPYSRTGGRVIVLAVRRYRSKWTTLQCFCKRERRDGLCKTLDQLVPFLAHPERVRFEHVGDVRASRDSGRAPSGSSSEEGLK